MNIQLVITALLLAAVSAGTAAADGFYVELDVGASFIADADLSGSGLNGTAHLDPGFNVGGAAGYRFLDRFRAEVSLDYRRAEVDKVKGGGVTLAGAGDAGVFSAMANGYFDIDLGWAVQPYVGAGIGIGVVDIDSDSSANILIVDDTSTEFAWNVMAGLSYPITEKVILSGGYRYFSTTDATLRATLVGVGSANLKAEIGVHEMVFGVRYEF